MIALTEKGMGRQEAHELVRTNAQVAFKEGRHLKELVIEKKILDAQEAEKIFDYSTYIGDAVEIVENAVKG
jgi:adenylosuccinate lyase